MKLFFTKNGYCKTNRTDALKVFSSIIPKKVSITFDENASLSASEILFP